VKVPRAREHDSYARYADSNTLGKESRLTTPRCLGMFIFDVLDSS
jgi:hypothetical protein